MQLTLREPAWGFGQMAMHLEFVVLGPPISNQQSTPQGKSNLTVCAHDRRRSGPESVDQSDAVRALEALEFMVREVFERRVGQRAGTQPLENLLQRIVKDGYLPRRVAAYANAVRELGNIGTHSFGERICQSDVLSSLTQLTVILDWYFLEEWPHRKPAATSLDPTSELGTLPSASGPSGLGEAPPGDFPSSQSRAPDLEKASESISTDRPILPAERPLSSKAKMRRRGR